VLEPQKIKLDFQAPAESEKIKLSPDQRRHLFLILKEVINNIARHAGCASVSISIKVSHNRLIVDIRDDGRGFSDPSQQPNGRSGGQGLGNMQSRAAQLGGQLTVFSRPNYGTELCLTIPLKKP
jgi:signal transduction histidine kinase